MYSDHSVVSVHYRQLARSVVTLCFVFGRRVLAEADGRVLRFPLPRLYAVLLHRQRPIDLKPPK